MNKLWRKCLLKAWRNVRLSSSGRKMLMSAFLGHHFARSSKFYMTVISIADIPFPTNFSNGWHECPSHGGVLLLLLFFWRGKNEIKLWGGGGIINIFVRIRLHLLQKNWWWILLKESNFCKENSWTLTIFKKSRLYSLVVVVQ